MLVDLVNEQSKTCDVHLIIINDSETKSVAEKISKRVIVHRLKRKPGNRNILRLIYGNIKLCAIKPDVVHCHSCDLVEFYNIAKLLGIRMYLTVHNTHTISSCLKKYSKVFAISNSVKTKIQNLINKEVIIIYNGIKTDSFKTKKVYTHSTLRMVQIGRLNHSLKGQDLSIQAVERLVHTNEYNNIHLDFIGVGASEEYLKALATKLNVSSYCTFRGQKSREWISEHLCDYDLLLQPSRYEGFGLTVAESMAARVPVLVSNTEGPMEIIDNGRCGYYFIFDNSEDMADKIEIIYKNFNNTKHRAIINQAHSRVKSLFDIRNTANNYLSAY